MSFARALLQPNLFFEACSNSILEAESCGTPVIAFDNGSNREIIKNGRTGFIANKKSLASSIQRIGSIRREDCRMWIEKNFSQEKMVAGYEKIYQRLLAC